MRYWRLFVVSFLLTLPIAGCHHKAERTLPPSQAQAPIVSEAPVLPPLVVEPVILAQYQPPPPTEPPPVTEPPAKKHVTKTHHRHPTTPTASADSDSPDAKPPAATEAPATAGPATPTATAAAPGTAVIGQLSADDATATPSDVAQAKHLVDATESELKKLSPQQQADHKDAIVQVDSFLSQARQALNMNDVVGAQTLANKAKILLDELSK